MVAGRVTALGDHGLRIKSQVARDSNWGAYSGGRPNSSRRGGVMRPKGHSVGFATQVGRLDADAVAMRVVVEVIPRSLAHRIADLQADVIVGRAKAGNEREERPAIHKSN